MFRLANLVLKLANLSPHLISMQYTHPFPKIKISHRNLAKTIIIRLLHYSAISFFLFFVEFTTVTDHENFCAVVITEILLADCVAQHHMVMLHSSNVFSLHFVALTLLLLFEFLLAVVHGYRLSNPPQLHMMLFYDFTLWIDLLRIGELCASKICSIVHLYFCYTLAKRSDIHISHSDGLGNVVSNMLPRQLDRISFVHCWMLGGQALRVAAICSKLHVVLWR